MSDNRRRELISLRDRVSADVLRFATIPVASEPLHQLMFSLDLMNKAVDQMCADYDLRLSVRDNTIADLHDRLARNYA